MKSTIIGNGKLYGTTVLEKDVVGVFKIPPSSIKQNRVFKKGDSISGYSDNGGRTFITTLSGKAPSGSATEPIVSIPLEDIEVSLAPKLGFGTQIFNDEYAGDSPAADVFNENNQGTLGASPSQAIKKSGGSSIKTMAIIGGTTIVLGVVIFALVRAIKN